MRAKLSARTKLTLSMHHWERTHPAYQQVVRPAATGDVIRSDAKSQPA